MLSITAMALLVSTSWSASLLSCPALPAATQSGHSVYNSRVLPLVKYCALMDRARSYRGKLVRVTASWQFDFETTRLFDRACPEQPGIWLEFADDKDTCPQTKKNRDAPGTHDKEAEVTVTGRLIGPGRYGHLGAYEYKFVVTCLQKIKITGSDLK